MTLKHNAGSQIPNNLYMLSGILGLGGTEWLSSWPLT